MAPIIRSAWGVDWNDEALLELLLDKNLITEVLKVGEEILGYYCLDQRGDFLFVVSIQVSKRAQRKSLGRDMMQRIESLAVSAGLEGIELCVQITNERAIGFYEHLGYRAVARVRNNLVMRKLLCEGD